MSSIDSSRSCETTRETTPGSPQMAQIPRIRMQRPMPKNKANPIVAWVWRSYIWTASTFSLGMLEVWEQLLVLFVVLSLSSLLWWSFYFHFPNHIRSVVERGTYYIFGTSTPEPQEAIQYAKNSHSEL